MTKRPNIKPLVPQDGEHYWIEFEGELNVGKFCAMRPGHGRAVWYVVADGPHLWFNHGKDVVIVRRIAPPRPSLFEGTRK